MAETAARIRPFQPADQKTVRFYASKGEMEGLTAANLKVYTNVFVIALWIGLSSAFTSLMGWWPGPEQGLAGYLSPIPAFASVAVPFMFAADWLNRPVFEKKMNDSLRKPDLVDPGAYYSRSPASGLWILEYKNSFVGLIAVDASSDSTSEDVIIPSDEKEPQTRKETKKKPSKSSQDDTSSLANIRHFFVEEPYRSTSVQDDLLEHALKHVFQSKKVQRVKAIDISLVPYIGKALRKQGFASQNVLEKVGVLGWPVREALLDRATWQKRRQ